MAQRKSNTKDEEDLTRGPATGDPKDSRTASQPEASHTPGPWLCVDYRVFKMAGIHIDKQIAWTANNAATRTQEAQSNARLISAAPDLLTACKEWLKFIDLLPASTELTYASGAALLEARDQTEAAIAKAEAQS